MACSGCNSTNCRGCKDIKINLPAANGIDSVTDNGDGTFTITTTDGTATVITMTVPNDNWVEFDEATNIATAPVFTGTATLNGSIALDGVYKVINSDTIYIRCEARMNCDITALDNSINFNFDLGNIVSTWYTGSKLPTTALAASQTWVPISIISTTTGTVPNTIGRAYAAQTPAPDGLIAVGNTNLQLKNGTYDFVINFQMTCKLI